MSGGFQFGFDLTSDSNEIDEHDTEDSISHQEASSTINVLPTETSPNVYEPPTKKMQLTCIDILQCQAQRQYSSASIPYETIPLPQSQCSKEKNSTSLPPLKRISNITSTSTSTSSSTSSSTLSMQPPEIDLTNTDLISGQYEGGLKVWECSLDLCHYLSHQISTLQSLSTHHPTKTSSYLETYQQALSPNGHILELGCGHGLPGCLMLREGTDNRVLFSDYNPFVLEQVTFPNILLNAETDMQERTLPLPLPLPLSLLERFALIGGDWMELSHELHPPPATSTSTQTMLSNPKPPNRISINLPPKGRFDLVLAAETTYTETAARETAVLLSKHLTIDTGIGLVSMKRYYFGVGGGVDAFRTAADAIVFDIEGDIEGDGDVGVLKGRLEVQTLQVYDNGVSNIRELLQVRCVPIRTL